MKPAAFLVIQWLFLLIPVVNAQEKNTGDHSQLSNC